ncbi:MAG: DUF3301 domain-containing protein [Rhodanobacteraceae bacterium]|nr:MAG: DUF3301 domain-containing protein [Rhodanobacteraceae bacterium]
MQEVFWPLLFCLALGATWYHVLRLRERATLHARRLCERHGLQMLDDSVALHRLRLQRQRGKWQVLREYRFDTSLGGNDRRTASLTLRGDHVMHVSLPEREPAAPVPGTASAAVPYATWSPRPEPGDNNVVPIERARRTLH